MNPLCSEAAIRKAADWRAFKQGAELIAAVSSAEATDTGWRGAVRDGPRPLKVAVIARSPTDIEARCPCRDNQSTGAFCRHAVAVGLVLACGKFPSPALPEPTPPPPHENPAAAYRIELPPPWRRLIMSGRLAAKISVAKEPPGPEDARIATWLADRPAGGMVQLDGQGLADFLIALADHPRVTCEGNAVEIATGGRLRVGPITRCKDRVVIEPGDDKTVAIGSRLVQLDENGFSILADELPADFFKLAPAHPLSMALRTFLERAAALGDVLEWPPNGWLASLRFVAAAHEIEITLSADARGLIATPLARYPNEQPVPPGQGNLQGLPALSDELTCHVRDREAEMAVLAILNQHGFTATNAGDSSLRLSDDDRIADFLAEGLPTLEARFTIHHGPGLAKRLHELSVVTPSYQVVGSGEDWLAFDLSFQTNDSSTQLDSAEVWRLLKSGGGSKRKQVAKMLSEVVEPLFSDLDLKQEDGRFIAKGASVYCIRKLFENKDNPINVSELSIKDFEIPPGLNAQLRPYQLAGAAWLMNRLKSFGGALLADDMGLGKTIQTITSIECLFETCPVNELSVLVVATTSLLGNWEAEFSKFAPARRVRIFHGKHRDVEKNAASGGEVWLTSYATLARDLAWYLRREFLAVVVDEASLMRNPDTDHAKALFKLRAAHRIALTGTPIENGVRDLWSIFRFIQPAWLGGRREFLDRYESPVGGGDPWALRRLRIKTSPFLLRRTKQDVAPELPGKIIIDEWCGLSRDQQSVYRELLVAGRRNVDQLEDTQNRGAARMQMLTTLLRMRQACCDLALLGNDRLKQLAIAKRSAKLERLLELLDEAVSGGHRVLVFSQFRAQLVLIHACLDAQGVRCLQLDGKSRDRQTLVDRFQAPDGPPVFLISLKAGGYGLNLTAADVVIHFDPWWNPAAEAQATDRAHRIGQTRPVTVYRLLTRGTVEEKVVALQRKKRVVSAAIDEAGAADNPGWNEQDLAALLG